MAYPDERIFLVVDNAAWHGSKALVVPDNIELFPLLPYTPELNPIKMIWDEIREKGFRNEIFPSLAAVVDRLCTTVVDLMYDRMRIASIAHRNFSNIALMF